MALKLKDKTVQGDCKSLKIYDKTGEISVDNLGGWGAPNPEISDVSLASIKITTKDNAVPYEFDVYPTLPNVDDLPYTILPTDIGYTTKIPDQALLVVYTVSYTVSGIQSGVPFTQSIGCYVPISCDMDCCLANMVANEAKEIICKCPSPCDCTCGCAEKKWTSERLDVLITGWKKLVEDRQINMSKLVLVQIQQICNCQ